MKRPKWIILVGMLAILLGLKGIMSHGLSLVYMAVQQERVESVSQPLPSNEAMPNSSEKFHHHPSATESENSSNDHTSTTRAHWPFQMTNGFMVFEMISFVIACLYFLAGLFLLTKSYGVKTFYSALAASLLVGIIRIAFISQGKMTPFVMMAPMLVPGMIIDLLLGAIVFAGTRFQPPEHPFKTDAHLLSFASSIWLKPIPVGIPVVTGAFAVLFALIFPVWIMGMPGIDNAFAQGWRMGFEVIRWYPITWLTLFCVSWMVKKFIRVHHRSLSMGSAIGFSVLLVLALLRLGQAIHLMTL